VAKFKSIELGLVQQQSQYFSPIHIPIPYDLQISHSRLSTMPYPESKPLYMQTPATQG